MRSASYFLLLSAILAAGLLVFPASADNSTASDTTTTVATTIPATAVTTVVTTLPTTTATPVPTTSVTTIATTAPVTTVTTDAITTTATTVSATTVTTTTTTAAISVPVASFGYSPSSGTLPLLVQFTDTSSNSPTSWSWDFGDSSTSADQNPAHTYSTAGTYTVSLTASNSAGSNTITLSGIITASAAVLAPVASFSQSGAGGPTPYTVVFTDTSLNTPTSWSWDFGDSNTSSTQNPSHTYLDAGTYTVSLTATNAGGSNQTTVAGDVVVTAGSGAPVASFSETPTAGVMPLAVQFTDSSSNTPTSWSWNFGDGGSSSVQNPLHTYQAAGDYTVSLLAANAAGQNTTTRTVTITALAAGAPVQPEITVPVTTAAVHHTISFAATPLSGASPLTVSFSPNIPGSPRSLNWDFGDGGTSSEKSPTYTYTIPGTYTVILTATYPEGKVSAEKTDYIIVSGKAAGAPLPPITAMAAIAIAAVLAGLATRSRNRD